MTDEYFVKKLYPKLTKTQIAKLGEVPTYTRPVITLSDKQSKYITRYFVRHFSARDVVEVDKKQYNQFKTNSKYITIQLNWKIVGKIETIKQANGIEILGVVDTNKITTSKADLTFGGLMNYITNYSEFWLGES